MVASASEREHFRAALNERVAEKHADVRGRPVWLFNFLTDFRAKHRSRKYPEITKQTCAYWLKGDKLPTGERLALLCDALGMTRGQLFGETQDERLALIIRQWPNLSERKKEGLFSLIRPEEAIQDTDAVVTVKPVRTAS